MFKKLKQRIQYYKDIKNGVSIPLVNIVIDINKYKVEKYGSCTSYFHPNIHNELSEQQIQEMQYHLGKAVDIIRDNIDVDKLR